MVQMLIASSLYSVHPVPLISRKKKDNDLLLLCRTAIILLVATLLWTCGDLSPCTPYYPTCSVYARPVRVHAPYACAPAFQGTRKDNDDFWDNILILLMQNGPNHFFQQNAKQAHRHTGNSFFFFARQVLLSITIYYPTTTK